MTKVYIGDAVYVSIEEYPNHFYEFILTTEDGTNKPTNRIVLEPEVAAEFVKFYSAWVDCSEGDYPRLLKRPRQEEST